MVRVSPTVRRKRLGNELSRLREAAGKTGEEVTQHMEWGASSKIYRIEKGEIGVQPSDLKLLLAFYEVTDAELFAALRDLGAESRKRGWWAPYSSVMNRNYATYIGLESGAAELRCYDALVMNGLVQTESYARALFQAYSPNALSPAIDRKIELRMERQKRLFDGDPLGLSLVVDESVLLRRVGGKRVMYEQFTYLQSLIETERISFRILPLETGAHPGMISSFTYVHFSDSRDPDVVYLEGLTGDTFVEGEVPVKGYQDAFETIRANALDAVASLNMIKKVMRSIKQNKET